MQEKSQQIAENEVIKGTEQLKASLTQLETVDMPWFND